MKSSIQNSYSNPAVGKIFEWIKILSLTGSVQVIVQAAGFVCGIFIIRFLPTQEYALYTLANTMLGTMVLLGNGGISTGVMAQGGKVWQDKEKLGLVLATGIDLRRKFILISLVIFVPILAYLLFHHGASWFTIVLILGTLIPSFLATLSDSLLQIVPKLQQNLKPLQINQLQVGLGRLFITGLLFIFPWTAVALLANAIPQIYGNFRLRKLVSSSVNIQQLPNETIRKEVLNVVKRILPGAIYYCLSGQITIFLLSFMGSTTSLAQIGAVSRLAMVLNLLNVLFLTLIVPRFARMEENAKTLLQKFLQIQFGLILINILIVGIVYLAPSEILWILGGKYSTLNNELLLTIISSCLNLLWGASFSLYSSRGWIISPFVSIAISASPIILGCFLIDLSSVKEVLLLNIVVNIIQLFLHFSYGYIKIKRVGS